MTMEVTIKHSSEDPYQARVKVAGNPDIVLKPGEETKITMWSSISVHIFEEDLEEKSD